jgi:hypothetical protein
MGAKGAEISELFEIVLKKISNPLFLFVVSIFDAKGKFFREIESDVDLWGAGEKIALRMLHLQENT